MDIFGGLLLGLPHNITETGTQDEIRNLSMPRTLKEMDSVI